MMTIMPDHEHFHGQPQTQCAKCRFRLWWERLREGAKRVALLQEDHDFGREMRPQTTVLVIAPENLTLTESTAFV